MKVAFVSDTHFGYPRFESDASIQGREAIIDAAKKADLLVLGGDIFDHRIPKLETILEVAKILQEARKLLPKASYPAILGIHGTHERRAKDALNPVSMLAQMGLMEDLHNKTIVIEKDGERLSFCGMGGIPDDLVKEAFLHLSCQPTKGAINFFVFHQTLQEFVPAPVDFLASINDLPAGYDYYLCGHIHARTEMMGGKLLIPGSTVITQMKDEERKEKGYYIIDTKADKGKQATFIPIKTRPFEICELNFQKAKPSEVIAKIEEEIERLMKKEWASKPVIKVRLKGNMALENSDLDLSKFENDERAFIFIDNRLDGMGMAAELAALKEERMSRATPLELGIAMLKERAAEYGLSPRRAEELFEKYSSEE